MTFGGRGQFRAVGQTELEGARRQIDMALDAGVNLVDTADVYTSVSEGPGVALPLLSVERP
jgi:aryl-alcohol dehydrogenase-like predicted oxidoreductase